MNTFPLNNTLYNAEDMAAYYSTRTRGVYSDDDEYKVTGTGGLTFSVSPGRAWLAPTKFQGLMAWQPTAVSMSVSLGPTGTASVSSLILRYTKATNSAELVLQLEDGNTPHIPEHTEDVEELTLAFITASFVNGISSIRDLRADPTYCGVMSDGVTGIPTQGLIDKANADFQAAIDAATSTATNAADAAAASATEAGGSAAIATAQATASQSWAVGGTGSRTGEDTNNAKYWSEQAENAAGGGVASFNGRTGVVLPQAGDYTAAQVGALPADTVISSRPAIATAFLRTTVNVSSTSSAYFPFSSITRSSSSSNGATFSVSSNAFQINDSDGGVYDVFASFSMYMTTFAASTSARIVTIRSHNGTSASTLAQVYVDRAQPSIQIPEVYLGTYTANQALRGLSVGYQFQSGDSFGLTSTTIFRDFVTFKAFRRG